MTSVLAQLEQSGLATWISESGVLYGYPLILFLHTLGLSTVVGISAAIDLRLLGVGSAIPLASLEKLFGLLWAGFALTAATGTLLFVADATKHASNPAFFVKLMFVAGGVATVALLRRRVFRGGGRGPLLAAASLGCWLVAITAGRLMAYVSEYIS
ncbi:MAG: DUF2214 domain-containing protein [Acidobacteria bacterium]|nr:DUF2214 domain-containing protein [Acidobacteriota bacterium]